MLVLLMPCSCRAGGESLGVWLYGWGIVWGLCDEDHSQGPVYPSRTGMAEWRGEVTYSENVIQEIRGSLKACILIIPVQYCGVGGLCVWQWLTHWIWCTNPTGSHTTYIYYMCTVNHTLHTNGVWLQHQEFMLFVFHRLGSASYVFSSPKKT